MSACASTGFDRPPHAAHVELAALTLAHVEPIVSA